MISPRLLEQVPSKCKEGLGLALASDDDGAVMVFHWCNKSLVRIMGFDQADVIGQRATIFVSPDMDQSAHLLTIDKLMRWEHFSVMVRLYKKNGDPVWVTMTWTPLTDPEDGSRWWLCSLIELQSRSTPLKNVIELANDASTNDLVANYTEQIAFLESENRRLRSIATAVTRDSNEDPLTGLSNRRHFEANLSIWISSLRRSGTAFAILYIDLDRFKAINDTLGHEAGDSLLVAVASMLKRITSDSDLVARLGGDEFVILRPLGESALEISGLADVIMQEMSKPFEYGGKLVSCGASVGLAIADENTKNPEEIVGDADTALYHAKSAGRGRWSFFTAEMHTKSLATRHLATELLVACEREEFVPYFQPLVNASTGQITGVEVLVRWSHPTKGLMPPADFLGVAAQMGILAKIDAILFSRLAEAVTYLDKAHTKLSRFAINVSAGRLSDTTLLHEIKVSGIDPTRLTVELVESVYLEQIHSTTSWTLEELREIGVEIAVDDFGTGHASVQGLLQINPDILKIDRQFIQPAAESQRSRALIESLIGIGKSLGLKVVAEGVETEDQAQLARELGCDILQGFYFGKPMAGFDLFKMLNQTSGCLWRSISKLPQVELSIDKLP
ncbi:EAL domain-containing protein [Gymnodinialimonas hymeniacidonis]|uniref:EAL domain-containing protein n=1 Tax=Gymnodinialimonas hymeniacidonis TaxID=3126508 RepID=UPI0034C5FFFC